MRARPPFLWALALTAALCGPVLAHNTYSVPPPTGVVNGGLSASDGIVQLKTGNDLDLNAGVLYDSQGVMCLGGTGAACSTLASFGASDVAIPGALHVQQEFVHRNLEQATAKTLNTKICGNLVRVTAGVDGGTLTLPGTIGGCTVTFAYIGADGGALLDISPDSADAIHGTCSTGGVDVEFSGADDANVQILKAAINTGDYIILAGDGVEGWYVVGCKGVWGN